MCPPWIDPNRAVRTKLRPLVIAAAANYGPDKVLPLVVSLYRSGYFCNGGQLALAMWSNDHGLDELISEWGFLRIDVLPKYPYLGGLSGDEEWLSMSRSPPPAMLQGLILLMRLTAVAAFLQSPAGRGFTHIMSLDSRDVIVQSDPFQAVYVGDGLIAAKEAWRIAECPINSKWLNAYSAPGFNATEFMAT